jgi:hypothetical protein
VGEGALRGRRRSADTWKDVDIRSTASWARILVLAGALVLAAGLRFGAGFGPVAASGVPSAAAMAFGLVLYRRPRPVHVPANWTDPCLLVTVGVAVLAFTQAGVSGGAGLAAFGLAA